MPPPSHGSPVPGSSAIPLSVLISDSALAPAASAALATAGTSVAFGVSFTISGLAVSGRTRSSSAATSAGSAPITSPVSTFGHETFSSSAATSARGVERLDQLADLLAA